MPSSAASRARTPEPVESPSVSLRLLRPQEAGPARWLALLIALRPAQWSKNLLVLVPLFTAHAYGDPLAVRASLLMFAAWCLAASGVYLVNDLFDIEADRQHPEKRHRPFASGTLAPQVGWIVAPVVTILAIAIAYSVSPLALATLVGYVCLSEAYSSRWKRVAVVDAFVLTALYSLRIVGGAAATGHYVSVWLLAFSGFFFLSLAFLKRSAELARVERDGQLEVLGRGYRADDQLITTMFGVAGGFLSAQVLLVYVNTDVARSLYRSPGVLIGIVPVMLMWICRLWLLAHRGQMPEDPVQFSLHDRFSWCLAAVVAGCFLVATTIAF